MAKGIRRQGRELALKVLYSLPDHEGGSLDGVFADFWRNFRFRDDPLGEAEEETGELSPAAARLFAEQLVNGVAEQLERIDRLIEEHSNNWALDRMARVDLALLRMAAYELLCTTDVPASVVISNDRAAD